MSALSKWLWLTFLVGAIVIVGATSPQLGTALMQQVESTIASDANVTRGLLALTADNAEVAQGEAIEIDVLANDTMLTEGRLLAVSAADV